MIGVFIWPGTHAHLYGVLEMDNIIDNEITRICQELLQRVAPSVWYIYSNQFSNINCDLLDHLFPVRICKRLCLHFFFFLTTDGGLHIDTQVLTGSQKTNAWTSGRMLTTPHL